MRKKRCNAGRVKSPGEKQMEETGKEAAGKRPAWFRFRNRWGDFVRRVKALQGDPHYIAMGLAIGVFVAITPTIPFHTVLAILLAFVLRGSKPAAIIGVWVCNPVTVLPFYIGCYEVGILLLNHPASNLTTVLSLFHTLEGPLSFSDKCVALLQFLKQEMKVFYAMIAGGVVLGLPAGIISYFITRKIVTRLRHRS